MARALRKVWHWKKITPIEGRRLNPVAGFFGSSTLSDQSIKIKPMRSRAVLVVAAGAALVAGLALGVGSGKIPLGIPGEWVWLRTRGLPSPLSLAFGLLGLVGFSTFAASGFRSLSRMPTQRRETAWLSGLCLASILAQGLIQDAAPEGYGLSKWIIALESPGSSGYYTVAKNQMADPERFLADYPAWIHKQDALHVGTHPPGLFVLARSFLGLMEAHPDLARRVVALSPPSVSKAIVIYRETHQLARADAASLTLTGALTLLGCSLTVVPLYLLARTSLPASSAWVCASFWPLVPSALLFQPTADTAFPLLSTSALALACWGARVGSVRGLALCAGSGLVLAAGMMFTLAFLPVGLVVALVLVGTSGARWTDRACWIVGTGLGFVLGTLAWWTATSANPLAIWWTNQQNHARFYVDYPRTYWLWVFENPVELAIALGLPTAVWSLVGFVWVRKVPRVAWASALVLVLLTLSGKNLSEVARLWLPLMPGLLVAAGQGFQELEGGPRTLACSLGVVGLQALILEAQIQVVYPI